MDSFRNERIIYITFIIVLFILFLVFLILWIQDEEKLPPNRFEGSIKKLNQSSISLDQQVNVNCLPQFSMDELTVNQQYTTSALVMQEFCKRGINIDMLQQIPNAIYPWSLEYNTLRLNTNQVLNIFPWMILYPENDQEIQSAIKWAVKYNIPIAVRSGGKKDPNFFTN